METPVHRNTRLIVALEDLVAEEHAALITGDFEAANEIAGRAATVVEWLVAHASMLTPALHERLAAVRTRREANSDFLASELAQARDNLQQVATSRRTVAQVAPVYGRPAFKAPKRLSAVG